MREFYFFRIDYLGIDVVLTEREIALLDRYVRREIGFTRLYRGLIPLIRNQVPRGYYRSVIMLIVNLYERQNFIIESLERAKMRCARILLQWHVKTKYIKKHHNFITEAYASIELYLPEVYFRLNKYRLLYELNEMLFIAYSECMAKEYFFVAEEAEYDFEKAYVVEIKTVEFRYCIEGYLIDFIVGIGRREDATVRWNRDLSKRVEKCIEPTISDFIDYVRREIERMFGAV